MLCWRDLCCDGGIVVNQDRINEIEQTAERLLALARDTITVRFRFFDRAIARIRTELRCGTGGIYSSGDTVYIDPEFLLRSYMEERTAAVRIYMHVLLHLVFLHQFAYDKLDEECWSIASDMAVENIILEMNFFGAAMKRDLEARDVLRRMSRRVPALTADKIYRELVTNGVSEDARRDYVRLFAVDSHELWRRSGEQTEQSDELMMSEEDWRKIARRIQTELKAFTKDGGGSESLLSNVDEAVRPTYNYGELLRRFVETGEVVKQSDDEFDYVYYTYGLRTYKNMPLIEPLEYVEEKRVREIVIAIDTSASCRGDTVKSFVQRTYELLKSEETFFRKINVHIVQCDLEIQSDTRLESDEDFKEFIEHGEIKGFGATDFRPVFDYVDRLRDDGEFENLKGLIYFTDGYGIYPERVPDYDVIFAFVNEDGGRQTVPGWAMKVVMEDCV